jgi:hypothetical protein
MAPSIALRRSAAARHTPGLSRLQPRRCSCSPPDFRRRGTGSRRTGEHPYQQLARQLRQEIETGKIASQLPSITNLTKQTGLAVGTVRRAINILVTEGLAETVPGRGTFVKR